MTKSENKFEARKSKRETGLDYLIKPRVLQRRFEFRFSSFEFSISSFVIRHSNLYP